MKLIGAGVGSAGRTATLDADGRFVFGDLAPGSYRLELEGVGIVADNIVLDAGRLYKLVFPLQSQVSGQVDGAREGAIAVLHAPPIWKWTRQALLDAAGRFAFSGLPAGRYRLQIPGADAIDLELNGENQLVLPRIDLTAGQRGVLRGRVVSPSGQAIEGVELSLWRDGTRALPRPIPRPTAHTASPICRPASITCTPPAWARCSRTLRWTVKPKQTHDITWLLGTIRGRVLSADGKPQAGQTVLLLRDGAEVARVETGADGAFRFTALAPGTYALAWVDGVPVASGIEVTAGSHPDPRPEAARKDAAGALSPLPHGG